VRFGLKGKGDIFAANSSEFNSNQKSVGLFEHVDAWFPVATAGKARANASQLIGDPGELLA
jgi:hypothetical protein